ncbi:uncharacterized protein LOC133121229 [Conger conger]|uniref:uncharacterized protein LOC133121229 n=1 Tax=Conger conger TaxID=82655 RepID=UPI002A59FC1C|nr:uncharacterized protein LOC133121229 [Conger conger]
MSSADFVLGVETGASYRLFLSGSNFNASQRSPRMMLAMAVSADGRDQAVLVLRERDIIPVYNLQEKNQSLRALRGEDASVFSRDCKYLLGQSGAPDWTLFCSHPMNQIPSDTYRHDPTQVVAMYDNLSEATSSTCTDQGQLYSADLTDIEAPVEHLSPDETISTVWTDCALTEIPDSQIITEVPANPGTHNTKYDLEETLITHCNLEDTYTTKADLQETYTTKADLQETYTTKADLQETYTTKADLQETYTTKTGDLHHQG